MYWDRLQVRLDRSTPKTKQEMLPKGVGVAKFDLTKTFRNHSFSRERVLYHQFLINNHSESILKSKTIRILMIISGFFFLSDFLRNTLEAQLYIHMQP